MLPPALNQASRSPSSPGSGLKTAQNGATPLRDSNVISRPDCGDPELKEWGQKLQQQNWRDVFVFFKHEDEGKAPLMAKRFMELAD